jgi:hypothetical protein
LITEENKNKILDSIIALEKFILNENYKGYDPFDALLSPLFRLPVFKKSKVIRLGFQQMLKRSPVNFRRMLNIKKGLNPVTAGLCVQAYSYLAKIFPGKENFYSKEIEQLTDELIKLRSKNYSGYCWGYDFDWEARYASIPAFTPTVVATGFITNSLYTNYQLTGNQRSIELCLKAVPFVMNDLNKIYFDEIFCYSYSPLDRQVVYNATLKGARVLLHAYNYLNANNNNEYNFSTEEIYKEMSMTISFVAENQNPDGSWSYSKGDTRTWIDNFHTGYILDILKEFNDSTGNNDFNDNIIRGKDYYFENFFYQNKIAKYYNNSLYPIDSTAAAQSIITSLRFDKLDLAANVALWMIENMQDRSGFFYYQKKKFFTNRISYMRWSNAWMLTALSFLAYKMKNNDLV